MTNFKEIGKKIKAAREEKGLSQSTVIKTLSEKNLKIARESLSKIETGNRSISALELNALCTVLDIDISSLFEDSETDDLVTLFRKKNFSLQTVEEIEKLQEMIKIFIYQKKIYLGDFKPEKRKPLWEECVNE